ncbi:MAG: aspartate kinase [Lepagella sp.]
MKVLKFGGTSVGSAQRIKNVAALVAERGRNVVVLSAMSGTTNSLVEISNSLSLNDIKSASETLDQLVAKYADVVAELFSECPESFAVEARKAVEASFSLIRSLIDAADASSEKVIVAQGEKISTSLMTAYLKSIGVKVVLLDAFDFMRIDADGEPQLSYLREHISPLVEANADAQIILTQGFICRNHLGEIDNLQRGGSDYTASLIGAAILADEVQIWTDIDGMHNNDPRFVDKTSPVDHLLFEEAAELAYFGAKILHPTCILPAKENNIPVRLLNTMQPDAPGTIIDNHTISSSRVIKAVAAKDNITAIKINSERMLLAHGFLRRVFEIFDLYKVPIDMITTSEVGVSLTIDDVSSLDDIVRDLSRFSKVSVDRDMTIICVVGDLQWHNSGLESLALEAMRNIPVRMISYGGSDHNISFLVRHEDKIAALNALSRHLFNH